MEETGSYSTRVRPQRICLCGNLRIEIIKYSETPKEFERTTSLGKENMRRNKDINVVSGAKPCGFKLSTIRAIHCLHYQVRRVVTLGSIGYSETFVSSYQTTCHQIPKNPTALET
jgi:hypothetical protein